MFYLGLKLLPCASGKYVEFKSTGEIIYIPGKTTPRKLFPGLEDILLADNLDPAIIEGLCESVAKGKTIINLCNLSIASLYVKS